MLFSHLHNFFGPRNSSSSHLFSGFHDTLTAINPNTNTPVPQGPSTDGSGQNFNAPAAIWMIFTLVTGIPLTFAGFRGWRLTTGVGVGLAATLVSWASFSNTMGAPGISDIVLTLICLGFFAFGFVFGLLEIGKLAGMVSLGILGGLSLGVRLMLFRSGLLIPVGSDGYGAGYVLGWAMIAILGVLGGLWIALVRFQRSGLLFACTATGTFLVALGVDLILNRQKGTSRGLIFLFDRNSSHIVDVITKGYQPSLTTQVILGSSLALIPILAFGQHRLFKDSFDRGKLSSDRASVLDSEYGDAPSTTQTSEQRGGVLMRHRANASGMFSGLWDGVLFKKGPSPNRFSV
ncbi:hypothetical protein NP233_g3559 [Leucocoprinus birnbaumii]|uniref:TM7S3/TM198-like domain-containing protein n=1 Tax=Leucocoprinus birnbaumii TaxID=56174 RepID=A0AAD5YTS5_9AGAR|nr:hypothetical protein NP233_g3559 [Leucocoprinus birnbaumii]